MKKQAYPSPLKLNLACGQIKEDGWVGVDIVKTDKVDVVHDLEKYPFPFEDNSVDEITISHFVEHLHNFFGFFDELYRIMKPGAKCNIVAPYYTSVRCWQDPTHTQAISEAKFFYLNKGWRDANKLDHYGVHCDFDFTYGYYWFPEWQSRSEDAKQFALQHYWNVISDIQVVLTKKDPSLKITP